jgi:glyoxylase-like metal-dependent hydrolase (beta-lactamase superfamily II)
MLREPRRGWLFTADHVLPYPAGNVWSFPGTDGDPFGEYLASLEQTLNLDATFTLPAHGLPVREGPRAMTQSLLDYHRSLAERTRALLRERPMKAWELVKLLSADVPADPQGARFSLAEELAVLTHLAKRGDARQVPKGQWELTQEVPG